VKASHESRVKRIRNPPSDYDQLNELIKNRFPELAQKFKENAKFCLSLQYKDDDGDCIDVENSMDLAEAYNYAHKMLNRKALKFLVVVHEHNNIMQL
jgi:hypothetical protein